MTPWLQAHTERYLALLAQHGQPLPAQPYRAGTVVAVTDKIHTLAMMPREMWCAGKCTAPVPVQLVAFDHIYRGAFNETRAQQECDDPASTILRWIWVPCRKCARCLSMRQQQWMAKTRDEINACLKDGGAAYLVTLTFDKATFDEYQLDALLRGIDVSDGAWTTATHELTNWIKLVRWHNPGCRIRYVVGPEVQPKSGLPHYHIAVCSLAKSQDGRPIPLIDPLRLGQYIEDGGDLMTRHNALVDEQKRRRKAGLPYRRIRRMTANPLGLWECGIVDVQPVQSPGGAAGYIGKYISKAPARRMRASIRWGRMGVVEDDQRETSAQGAWDSAVILLRHIAKQARVDWERAVAGGPTPRLPGTRSTVSCADVRQVAVLDGSLSPTGPPTEWAIAADPDYWSGITQHGDGRTKLNDMSDTEFQQFLQELQEKCAKPPEMAVTTANDAETTSGARGIRPPPFLHSASITGTGSGHSPERQSISAGLSSSASTCANEKADADPLRVVTFRRSGEPSSPQARAAYRRHRRRLRSHYRHSRQQARFRGDVGAYE